MSGEKRETLTWEDLRGLTVPGPDEAARERAQRHWDAVAKPLDGLGDFEKAVVRMAGIRGSERVRVEHPQLLVFCADNGIVAEGVSQSGQEVTAQVAANIARGTSTAAVLAGRNGCGVRVVDVGIATAGEVPGVVNRKVCRGTRDFLRERAMTDAQCLAAIAAGIGEAQAAAEAGVDLLCLGEMGIGNTTTSAALCAGLLDLPVQEVTGRGAGLDDAGLSRKREVISRALELYKEERADAGALLCAVGGLDIAALAGAVIGASLCRLPVVIDGVITAAAALCAERMVPGSSFCCLPSHAGREPALSRILHELGLRPLIDGRMALGEGSGAVMVIPLLRQVLAVYDSADSFAQIGVEQYVHYEQK